MNGYQLMTPGPVTLRQDVLREMACPMVPHYGPEWTSYYLETLDLLKEVFQTRGRVFPIPGSGSAALEAAISSSLPDAARLLVLSNGFFGERLAEIAASRLPDVQIVRQPMQRPITVEDLDSALSRWPGIDAVAVVHCESSSGLINPIEELAERCRTRGLLCIVDAISSLGGMKLEMDALGIGVCISASQKCLEGPPGLGLVAVGAEAWERIRALPARGWYLSLQLWDRYAQAWSDWHPYPITLAVPTFRALRRGVEHVLEEGVIERAQRHLRTAAWVTDRLRPLGYRPILSPETSSPTVLAFRPPHGVAARDVVSRLKLEHQILIASGMGDFADRAFRIGNMGIQASKEMLEPVIRALRAISSERRA